MQDWTRLPRQYGPPRESSRQTHGTKSNGRPGQSWTPVSAGAESCLEQTLFVFFLAGNTVPRPGDCFEAFQL
jgi:hypothetical protein